MVKEKRNYLILGISGVLIMFLSLIRVPLFHLFIQAIETKKYFLATFFSFTLANPYPLLPYLAYGFFGAMMGMMIFQKRNKLLKIIFIPSGMFFLIYGLSGMMNFDKTISTPDYFWYFKTNFELGTFMLLLILLLSKSFPKGGENNKGNTLNKNLGTPSFTKFNISIISGAKILFTE